MVPITIALPNQLFSTLENWNRIIGLLTAYSAAVLRSRRPGGYIAALLAALDGVLYVLLSLEAYSLLIGSLLLFAALAGVMYLTRNLDWNGLRSQSST